jgi:hypothetical protein
MRRDSITGMRVIRRTCRSAAREVVDADLLLQTLVEESPNLPGSITEEYQKC